MSDTYEKLDRGNAQTLAEFFSPIGEQLLSESERAKRHSQALSAALQDEAETSEQTPYELKAAKVRLLREQGDLAAAAAADGVITHAERHDAFKAFVATREGEAITKPRHPLTGGLLDGPGTSNPFPRQPTSTEEISNAEG